MLLVSGLAQVCRNQPRVRPAATSAVSGLVPVETRLRHTSRLELSRQGKRRPHGLADPGRGRVVLWAGLSVSLRRSHSPGYPEKDSTHRKTRQTPVIATLTFTPVDPNFHRFRSTINRFRDTVENGNPGWPPAAILDSILVSVTCHIYTIPTLPLPCGPKFSSVSLYRTPFQDMSQKKKTSDGLSRATTGRVVNYRQ